jgi:hypothetical protein
MTTRAAVPILRSAQEVHDLPRGRVFRIRFTKSMSWRDIHRVLYYTAEGREVRLTLRDGRKIVGTLSEAPGYFQQDNRVWLRVEGRKTRLGVSPDDIAYWSGFRAPTLAEAFTALVGATCSNPSPELAAETASIMGDMGLDNHR